MNRYQITGNDVTSHWLIGFHFVREWRIRRVNRRRRGRRRRRKRKTIRITNDWIYELRSSTISQERQTDRQTDWQTDWQIDRQTDRQTETQRQTDRDTETETDRQTDRQTDRETEREGLTIESNPAKQPQQKNKEAGKFKSCQPKSAQSILAEKL